MKKNEQQSLQTIFNVVLKNILKLPIIISKMIQMIEMGISQ